MALSRRDFLAALAATAALPSVARIGTGAPGDAASRFFTDEASAKKIGRLYLATAPAEADLATLHALIAPGGVDPEEWWTATSGSAFKKHVRTQVRADFGSDGGTRTAVLSGWVLAVTEARLCALISLER